MRLSQGTSKREERRMVGCGRRLAKHQHNRRNCGITKLDIVGVEAVRANQRNAIRKESLDCGPIVDIHELRRNQPGSDASLFHPRRCDQKKMNVEARQTTDFYPCHLQRQRLKTFLLLALHMVVPNIRGIGQDHIGCARACAIGYNACEITVDNVKPRLRPETAGNVGKGRVELYPHRAAHSLGAKYGERGGKKTAGSDRGIGKADITAGCADDGLNVASDIHSECVGRSELAQTIALDCRLARIDRGLTGLALQFKRTMFVSDHDIHKPSFARSAMRCSQTQSMPSAAS